MRKGSLAASAVALLAAPNSEAAAAEDKAEVVFHVFGFQWKAGT